LPEIEDVATEQEFDAAVLVGCDHVLAVQHTCKPFPANRQTRVSLRMPSPVGHPLSRRYYDPATGRELSDEQMVRGFEIEKDEYVIVTDEELERLAPERSRAIDLRRFVDADQIPPLYFERAYDSIAKFKEWRFDRLRSLADHRSQPVQRPTISGRADRDRGPLIFAVSVGLTTFQR
jgi:hypothetical protein